MIWRASGNASGESAALIASIFIKIMHNSDAQDDLQWLCVKWGGKKGGISNDGMYIIEMYPLSVGGISYMGELLSLVYNY